MLPDAVLVMVVRPPVAKSAKKILPALFSFAFPAELLPLKRMTPVLVDRGVPVTREHREGHSSRVGNFRCRHCGIIAKSRKSLVVDGRVSQRRPVFQRNDTGAGIGNGNGNGGPGSRCKVCEFDLPLMYDNSLFGDRSAKSPLLQGRPVALKISAEPPLSPDEMPR